MKLGVVNLDVACSALRYSNTMQSLHHHLMHYSDANELSCFCVVKVSTDVLALKP